MKKIFQFGFALVMGAGLLVSCDSAPKGDAAEVKNAETAAEAVGVTLNVDTAATVVNFTGNGVGKNHPGHFKVSGGTVAIKGKEITGGSFTIDVNSMTMHESGDFITGKLRPHLLSPDFFDATAFPSASFEITSVEPYTANGADTSVVAGANMKISGNLKLKDVVKNVTFPAKVDITDNSVSAVANFDIDRTLWGMNYGNDAALKDKMISPTVNMALNIQAKK